MNQIITDEKLKQYFSITKEALDLAQKHFDKTRQKQATEFFDMASRYYQDAHYFQTQKDDLVLAFAALNYAHGWLDAGARIGLFQVNDARLFTVESK